jgi:hypothetical protein
LTGASGTVASKFPLGSRGRPSISKNTLDDLDFQHVDIDRDAFITDWPDLPWDNGAKRPPKKASDIDFNLEPREFNNPHASTKTDIISQAVPDDLSAVSPGSSWQ